MTSIKDALAKWSQDNNNANPAEATTIELQFRLPPIEKMDNALSTLVKCEFLSLSTNTIDQITGLGGMKNLKVLSLARNKIKSFNGLQPVAKTLEQLWISYNDIEKMRGVEMLVNLKMLSMMYNLVKDWAEFDKLKKLPNLTELNFIGNKINAGMPEPEWLKIGTNRLPNLKILEGHTVREEEPEELEGADEIDALLARFQDIL